MLAVVVVGVVVVLVFVGIPFLIMLVRLFEVVSVRRLGEKR
jgi:hypothetical protein